VLSGIIVATMNDAYTKSIESWRAEMDAGIRGENSWLALVGLVWLQDGINTLGSSADCDVHLPKRAPALLGAIRLDGAQVTLQVDIGQSVDVNGVPVRTTCPLRSDDENNPSLITFRDLRMVIIRRGNRVGLRLWDNLLAREFPPRTWYDVDEKFLLQGLYTAYPVPVKVDMPNVQGEIESGYVQGYLSFKLDARSHSLDATELDDGRLHIQFGDLTSGVQTYPGGRYLQTEPVLEDGRVILDFNKAYNPPCAFSQFATCTFAPTVNHLKIAIVAGERYSGRH
jgi:uncharacterized protein (DUF1684 family)